VVFGVHSFIDWTWFVPGVTVIALACAGWVAGRGPVAVAAVPPDGFLHRARAGLRDPWRVGVAVLVLAVAATAAWAAYQPLRSVNIGNQALAALDDAGKDPRAYTRARALTEKARSANPLSVEPLFERYVVETLAGRKDVARQVLEEAVRLQPANPATWLSLTRFALDQEDDPKEALRLLGPALYLDPRSAPAAQIYLEALRRATEQEQAAQERTSGGRRSP
jgi:tetratricopeptide (TPR) repeat protein